MKEEERKKQRENESKREMERKKMTRRGCPEQETPAPLLTLTPGSGGYRATSIPVPAVIAQMCGADASRWQERGSDHTEHPCCSALVSNTAVSKAGPTLPADGDAEIKPRPGCRAEQEARACSLRGNVS